MEEKKVTKISLSTFFLIFAIIVIVVMAIFMYKFYNEKKEANEKSAELQAQITSLNATVNDLQEEIDSISNTKNSNTSITNTTKSDDSSLSNSEPNNTQNNKKSYDSYIGTWYNSETQNEITIKNITNNKITFTWFLYRLAGIDEDTTINFSNGEAIFYYEGYDDRNFDGINTEDEKYIRKATIRLDENGVNVNVEDVKSLDDNYTVLDNFSGSVYITEGLYSHPEKR